MWNNKRITIYTIISILLTIIMYEIGYCNTQFVNQIINKEIIVYNFSLCRIVIYTLIMLIYILYKNKFINIAEQTMNNKYKRILADVLCALVIINIIFVTIYIYINDFKYIKIGTVETIASILINLFIIYISNDLIKNIIITSCTFGMLCTFITDYNHAIDEKKHFMSAVNISFLNFDYKNLPVTDKKIEELPQMSKYLIVDKFLKNDYKAEITRDINMEDIPSTPATYSAISYVFPAIGITFARMLHGSIIDMYICGRIMNLILYTALIIIAIKLIPYKKNIFYIIAYMPFMLVLASSYSIDGICLGTIFIFIAYCLKIYKENTTIKIKQVLMLCALYLLLLTGKGIGYILIATLILILPIYNTIKQNKKYRPIIICSLIIFALIFICFVVYMKNTQITSDGDTRGGPGVNGIEQLQFVLSNPKHDIKLIINQIKETLLNYNWYTQLYPEEFFSQYSSNIFYLMLMYMLYISITEDDKNFNIKCKVIFLITFFLVFGMTSAVLYLAFTPVGASYVAGYQARYIFPILPLLLCCISNNKIKCEKSENRNMKIAIGTGIFLALGILQLIIV